MIKTIEEHCPKNHRCPVINDCPTGALSQETVFSPPKIDEESCIDCGICTQSCGVFRM